MYSWLLLTYSVHAEHSAQRVYIWRRLKRLGAISIEDGIWVLPTTPILREQLQWLAAEILEMGSEAVLWRAQFEMPGQEEALVERFQQQIDESYQKILAAISSPDRDLVALARDYQRVRLKDHFHSELGSQVRLALLAARGDIE